MSEKRFVRLIVLVTFTILAIFSRVSDAQDQSRLPDMKGARVKPFEAKYKSSSGSTFDMTVRHTQWTDGTKLLSMVIELESSQGIMVDHVGVSAKTMEVVYRHTPYFALGMDYLVAWHDKSKLDATFLPIGGGPPIHRQVELASAVFDANSFGWALASMDLKKDMEFSLPFMIAKKTGKTFATATANFKVMGMQTMKSKDGTSYECTRVEMENQYLGKEEWWVSKQAPYVIKRKTPRSTTELVRLVG